MRVLLQIAIEMNCKGHDARGSGISSAVTIHGPTGA